jgi:hypothetical protein
MDSFAFCSEFSEADIADVSARIPDLNFGCVVGSAFVSMPSIVGCIFTVLFVRSAGMAALSLRSRACTASYKR